MGKVALGSRRASRGLMKMWPGARVAARVPAGKKVAAIGDIHGRADLLYRLVDKLWQMPANADGNVLVFLGDYIDRGPASRGVIEYLVNLQVPGWELVFLRGNHDQSFLDFIADPGIFRQWRSFGAVETLVSYGVRPPRFESDENYRAVRDELLLKCPQSHLAFFERLRPFHREGDYLFVHAGIRPGVPMERQREEDLLWIREEFLQSERISDMVVVHGHSPELAPVARRNRIGLDTGAYATGRLTGVVLEDDRFDFFCTS